MPNHHSSKGRFFPVAISLLLHGALIAGLGWWGYNAYRNPPNAPAPPPQVPIKLQHVEQRENENPVVDERELTEKITEGVAEFEARPAAENIKTLENNAAWLESKSSERAVEQIATVLRRSVKAPQRAYEPADPPPAGEFDMRSMLPYMAEKKPFEDGIERTVYTWVDKAGRTMRDTRRKGVNKKGEAVAFRGVFEGDGGLFEVEEAIEPQLDAYYQTIERSTSTPLMRKLFQQGLLPALESYRQFKRQSAETSPPPSKPR